jgi:predicted esterase
MLPGAVDKNFQHMRRAVLVLFATVATQASLVAGDHHAIAHHRTVECGSNDQTACISGRTGPASQGVEHDLPELDPALKRALEQQSNAASGPAGAPATADLVDGGSLKYPDPVLLGNTRDPTAMVLMLHGLGDSAQGWAGMMPDIAAQYKHIIFVLPTAAVQPVSLNDGRASTSWYNIEKNPHPDGPEDVLGMRRSAQYTDRLVNEYAEKYNVPQGRVVYAGFSQGACMALFTGLTTSRGRPAGIAALSGYLCGRGHVIANLKHKDVPVFVGHGTEDTVIPVLVSTMSRQLLQASGVADVEYHQYPMGHWWCEAELEHLKAWLGRVVPK